MECKQTLKVDVSNVAFKYGNNFILMFLSLKETFLIKIRNQEKIHRFFPIVSKKLTFLLISIG